MARRRTGKIDEAAIRLLSRDDESFTVEAGPSTGSNEKLRLMILGGDDVLMDKACGTILGERQSREGFKFGILQPRTAQVCGRQVSVLKTPSYWLEHLKSHLLFSSGVKSLENDMKFFESLMFPGPHAFLLVHRDVKDSGKEYYLLRALSEVFGKEVLHYCMVLYIDQAWHNDPQKNSCVKMCGNRYHILHNTDDSVNELFKKTETDSRRFFIKHLECYKAAENYFEAAYEEKESKLRRELAENKDTAENLKKEINDMKELNAKVTELNERIKDDLKKFIDRESVSNELDALKNRENQMRKKVQRLKEELISYRDRENKISKELDALRSREKQMNEQLIIYRDRERELKEQLKDNEKQQQNNLTEAKPKEEFLSKKLQSECNVIQREEKVQAKEKEINEREKELDRRVKELEIREREVTQRDVRSRDDHLQATADPAVSRDKISPLDERKGELKSRDDSQASGSPGTQKPVRRNSKK